MNRRILLESVLLVLLVLATWQAVGQPVGVNITYNQTLNYTPTAASSLTTYGGSFTTMRINVTGQTMRWKAYIGNVSGLLTLDDGEGATVYDWSLSTITGEVYATRNASFAWTTASCANNTNVRNESVYLNHTQTDVDSINRTFNRTVHRGFYVGTIFIANSTCPSIATYVSDVAQAVNENASFQEVLLADDSNNVVFATLLEDAETGYDDQFWDFQLIVPENFYASQPTTYYFYAEIG